MVVRAVWPSLLAGFAMLGGGGPALAEGPDRPRLEQVWVDPVRDLAPDALAAARISNILFVNRCPGGCVITPGENDARLNTSSITRETVMLGEFNLGDEAFDQIIECLRDVYSPYDVQIVTEDPAEEFHHEAILAGTPQELGLTDPQIGGIAPASCGPLNNVMSFSFANRPNSDVETLCWTVAQESAHSFGLPNHVYDCLDPMTYLDQNCGRKYFRNRAIQCGDFQPKPCICGVNAQNSHLELMTTFGVGTPPPPPEVTLLFPAADSSVSDNFSIFFQAIDPRLVHHVDVYLNGSRYTTLTGHDYANRAENYSLEAPDHPDGFIDIELRAYNEINTDEAGVATATVLKGEPCTSDDQCFDFMECTDGRCVYPPPSGELGDACSYDQFCLNNSCAEVGGERRCSQGCNPNVADSCPAGYDCQSAGFCWPVSKGGCGAVAGGQGRDQRWPLAVASLFAGALLLRRRDRRRG